MLKTITCAVPSETNRITFFTKPTNTFKVHKVDKVMYG